MNEDVLIALEEKVQPRMPNIAEFERASTSSDRMFGWELSDDEVKSHKDTYGFVYKCLADNMSNPGEWLEFGPAIGRNAIAAILYGHESHLLTGCLTLFYPENGLSPDMQSKFVSMLCKHPQAKDIDELRIVTRSAWFLSDCKSVRVARMEDQNVKDATFYLPAFKASPPKESRLNVLRGDPYFRKGRAAMFFNHIKDETQKFGFYLAEDANFVYWTAIWHKYGEILVTPHYRIWYELNAILLTKEMDRGVSKLLKEDGEASHVAVRDYLRQYEYGRP